MASLAEAATQVLGSAVTATTGNILDRVAQKRKEAFTREGWDRQDKRTSEQRTYEQQQKQEDRNFARQALEEDRAYQKSVRDEERSYQEGRGERKFEQQKELLKTQEESKPPSSAEIKAEQDKAIKEKEKQDAYLSTQTTLEEVDGLLSHPGLSAAVGASSLLPTIPGGDAANFETALDSFVGNLTLENMSKMKGVLSDSDIKILKSASSGLDIKMSEDEFKKRLGTIKNKLETKLLKFEPSQPTTEQQPQQQELTDDELINMYLSQ